MDKSEFEKEFKKKVSGYFSFIKRKNNPVGKLFDMISKEGFIIYAFGGFPRDIFLNGKLANPRDIDLVIYEYQMASFKEKFSEFVIGENKFGGLKLNYKGITVDLWPLEQTWAFKENYVTKTPFFQDLEKTTFLNIEGILFEVNPDKVKRRKVFYKGFYNGYESKVLELNLENNPFPDLNIVRALYFAKKFNFRIGPQLAKFIMDNYKNFEPNYLCKIYEKKYKLSFDVEEMERIIKALEQHFNSSYEPCQVIQSHGEQQMLDFYKL